MAGFAGALESMCVARGGGCVSECLTCYLFACFRVQKPRPEDRARTRYLCLTCSGGAGWRAGGGVCARGESAKYLTDCGLDFDESL